VNLGAKLGVVDLGAEFGAIDPGAEPALQVGPFSFSRPSFPFPLFLSFSSLPFFSLVQRLPPPAPLPPHLSCVLVGDLSAGEVEMAGESPT